MESIKDKSLRQQTTRPAAQIVTQSRNSGRAAISFIDNRPVAATQLQLARDINRSPQATRIAQLQAALDASGHSATIQRCSECGDPECIDGSGCGANLTEEESSGSDSDYVEPQNYSPHGYMDPTDYKDTYGGSDHSALDGKVWAAKLGGYPALWWKEPNSELSLKMTGSRYNDVQAAGGDDSGYTWHHCKDYSSGNCTFQQVPTSEHDSWGHVGGVQQYESDKGVRYS